MINNTIKMISRHTGRLSRYHYSFGALAMSIFSYFLFSLMPYASYKNR